MCSLGCVFAVAQATDAAQQAPAASAPASSPAETAAPADNPQQPETPAAASANPTQSPATTDGAAQPNAEPKPADSAQLAAPAANANGAQAQASSATPGASSEETKGAITEEEVKQLVTGRTLYLRDGYLDNSLSFDEHGKLIGHSPQGSYTLSLVEMDKVHLSKHKVELTGIRYGLHFLGSRADEDPTKAVDKVRITPKKKIVKITIDRELVVTPKKKKKDKNAAAPKDATGSAPEVAAGTAPGSGPDAAGDAEQAKAEMNAAPAAERSADAASVTTTIFPVHAA